MAWQTPKTDWHGAVDANGVYSGDRFNAADFNRIKNNLTYLRGVANQANVTIMGLGDRAEIWSKAELDAYSYQNFVVESDKVAEKMAQLGL